MRISLAFGKRLADWLEKLSAASYLAVVLIFARQEQFDIEEKYLWYLMGLALIPLFLCMLLTRLHAKRQDELLDLEKSTNDLSDAIILPEHKTVMAYHSIRYKPCRHASSGRMHRQLTKARCTSKEKRTYSYHRSFS